LQATRTRSLSVSLLGFIISTVLFLLCLSLFIFTARLIAPEDSEQTTVEYTLFLPAVPRRTAEGIKAGDTAVDAVRKGDLGRLSSVAVTPHKREIAEDGKLRIYEDPESCDIRLTVRAAATDNGRTVSGIALYIGTRVYLRLPAYTGSGICIKIKEVSA